MKDLFDSIPEPSDLSKKAINDLFVPYLFYHKEKIHYPDAAGVRHSRTVAVCICSHCQEKFIAEDSELELQPEGKLKHGIIATCPKCKVKTHVKHRSYGKRKLNEHNYVLVFCPENKSKVWLRGYYCYKRYHDYQNGAESERPEIGYIEEFRYLLQPRQKAQCWEKQYHYASRYCGEWVEINPREPFPYNMFGISKIYDIVWTPEEVSKTFLKYIDIDTYYEYAQDWYNSYSFNYYYSRMNPLPARFICDFAQFPIIESLLKAGFGEIAAERIIGRAPHLRLFDWNSDTLRGFFKKFSLSEVRQFKTRSYMMYDLKNWNKYKRAFKNPQVSSMLDDSKVFSGPPAYETFLDIVRKKGLEYHKALKLIVKSKRTEIPCTTALKIYEDYLEFAKRLNYDLNSESVLYPRDLYKAHDTAARLIKIEETEEQIRAMKKVTVQNVEKYSFEFGDLQIVVPSSINEIVDEGQKLEHCVGGYAARHADGKLSILFVRYKAAPSVPFVTMEVRGRKVIQFHGFKNDREKPLPKEVETFVKEFKKYIANPDAYRRKSKKARKTA